MPLKQLQSIGFKIAKEWIVVHLILQIVVLMECNSSKKIVLHNGCESCDMKSFMLCKGISCKGKIYLFLVGTYLLRGITSIEKHWGSQIQMWAPPKDVVLLCLGVRGFWVYLSANPDDNTCSNQKTYSCPPGKPFVREGLTSCNPACTKESPSSYSSFLSGSEWRRISRMYRPGNRNSRLNREQCLISLGCNILTSWGAITFSCVLLLSFSCFRVSFEWQFAQRVMCSPADVLCLDDVLRVSGGQFLHTSGRIWKDPFPWWA